MADILTIPRPAQRTALGEGSYAIWYYFSIALPIVGYLCLFLWLFYDQSAPLPDLPHRLLFYSKFLWFSGALVVGSNVLGLLWYGPERRDNATAPWNPRDLLTISYVSRGDNIDALGRAIARSSAALDHAGARYRIEVVTDRPVAHLLDLPALDIEFYVVPDEYCTARGTKYKARALHFLLERRTRQTCDNHWFLHLDEESSVTPGSVAGIRRFMSNPDNRSRIGQGMIKYNAYRYGTHLFITAMDNMRTGDDLGRFRMQYRMFGKPLFGMHGSFVLVPRAIEEEIGFDLGRKGSITEDAYFALLAQERGYRFGWVEGFIREQSPFTLRDIIRQRRRWFCGLAYLSFDPQIALSTRAVLMMNTALWSVAWTGPVITVANMLLGGGYFPLPLTLLAALIQGGYSAVYLVGAYENLSDANLPFARAAVIYAATLLLVPVSSIIEGTAVLYALARPVRAFDVVRK